MTSTKFFISLVAMSALVAASSEAQSRGIDVAYGRWWPSSGGSAENFSVVWRRPLFGPVSYGLGGFHLVDRNAFENRTQSGGEISLVVGNVWKGPYGIAGLGMGMRHDGGEFDANWSGGGGYAVSPLSFLRANLELRYRVEDPGSRGFWRLEATDRRGLMLQAGLAFRFGGASVSTPRTPRSVPPRVATAPGPSAPTTPREGESDAPNNETAALASNVVRTALDQMGSPYKWGGTGENGFDCSGLIQFAYQEHGILVPRVSRDQIRTGTFVYPSVADLQPGDILGFSAEGRGVTHVGLYLGDGEFIHSASSGVRVSSLNAKDANSVWWQQRWVAARRILN